MHHRLIRLLVTRLGEQRTLQGEKEVNYLDAAYIGQPYHGEVCLHFAIVHGNFEFVKLLIENGADAQV